jgi:hypothetical protein
MDAIVAIANTMAAKSGNPAEYDFGKDASKGFAALSEKQATLAVPDGAAQTESSPVADVSSRIALGLRSGFTSNDSRKLLELFEKSAKTGKDPDVHDIVLATYRFQMSSGLATAVQSMSTNVKQSIDKLITAN